MLLLFVSILKVIEIIFIILILLDKKIYNQNFDLINHYFNIVIS